MPLSLSILICSFNTRDDTLSCLESVETETTHLDAEAIVVDNGSTDGSAAAIAERFPTMKLIALTDNVGFAAANNLAAQHATGEHLLLLNPDTVLFEGTLSTILNFAQQHPDAGVYGGRTYFGDMTLNRYSCHGAPTLWSQICNGIGLSSLFPTSALFNPEGLGRWERDTVREVDCISGCFLLIRRSLWEQLSGFDTSFFMYGEDTDLCIRAQKQGARPLVCPDARLIHHGGRSEKVYCEKIIRLFRAKRQLFDKHWSPATASLGTSMLVMWALTRYVALSIASRLWPHCRESAEQWRTVFRRRSEYAGDSQRISHRFVGPASQMTHTRDPAVYD